MDNCKQCGNKLTHVEGRKEKSFCNVNCRNKYFYATRKELISAALNKPNPAPQTEKPSEPSQKKEEAVKGAKIELKTNDIAHFTITLPSEPKEGDKVEVKSAMAAVTIQAPAKNSVSETLEFPENWDKMGKTEKLKWLTANRK